MYSRENQKDVCMVGLTNKCSKQLDSDFIRILVRSVRVATSPLTAVYTLRFDALGVQKYYIKVL